MANTLDTISGELINIYENHSDLDKTQIISYMDEEKWFSAEAALEAGFADEIDKTKAAASIAVDPKYGYKHIPAEIAGDVENSEVKPPDNIRDFETALRDLGFSRKDAVKIAAQGFEADQRDSEPEPEQRDSVADVVETTRGVDPVTALRPKFDARKREQLKERLSNRG